MDIEVGTSRNPKQSQPQMSCGAGKRLKGSWRAKQHVTVHGKKLLCNPPHQKHCRKTTLAGGLVKLKADDENPGELIPTMSTAGISAADK